jgi:hypothetical protein
MMLTALWILVPAAIVAGAAAHDARVARADEPRRGMESVLCSKTTCDIAPSA